MMKKLGLLAFILGLVIAFALPAMAFTIDGAKGEKMYIGGIFMTDFGYWGRSKELIAGIPGQNNNFSDRTEFIASIPIHSTLHGSVEVGNVGGFWEFGLGTDNISGRTSSNPTNTVDFRKLYGYYNFGNCQLMAGKNDGYLYSVVPWQVMGVMHDNHVYGFGWGAFYDIRSPQVRFTQNVNKMFGWQISLVQPTELTDAFVPQLVQPGGPPAAANANNAKSYASWPLVAAKVMMNFGMVSLYPAFGIQQAKWNDGRGDDSVTAYYGLLPVVVKLNGFTGIIQGGWGQNINQISNLEGIPPAGAVAPGVSGGFQNYYRDASGSIKNTTGFNGFIDVSYQFGPAAPHLYFGYDRAQNSDIFGKQGGDDNNVRMMYGASINWMIAPSFYVIPEFTYYDYGKSPFPTLTNGRIQTNQDIGKEWIGGVEFRFVF